MKLKMLSTAMMLCVVPTTGVFAAALDRSGQSMSAFLQSGNYFEAGISILDPNVSGKEAGTNETHRHISDMADSYYFPSAALKVQANDKFSFGVLYDQPFGAKASFHGDNSFVSSPTDTVLPQAKLTALSQGVIEKTFTGMTAEDRVTASLKANNVDLSTPTGQLVYQRTLSEYNNNPASKNAIDTGVKQGVTAKVEEGINKLQKELSKGGATQVEVDSQNLAFVAGYQPSENWNIFAGGVYQTIKGNVSLSGQAYSLFNGYDASIKETGGAGWLAGFAYQIPDIALKASLTYRSKIDHHADIKENIPTLPALRLMGDPNIVDKIANSSEKTKITTPQSVNIDLQSGIMADTVAFANVRWVNWKDFSIQPSKFGQVTETIGGMVQRPNGFNLVEYSKDQWSVTTGVGRKLSEKWSGNISVGWDSGAGNPVTTLGPTEGYWNTGLGLQYNPTPATFIAGGVKYFWLGDAKAQTGAQAGGKQYVADFTGNNALAYGLKLGYRF